MIATQNRRSRTCPFVGPGVNTHFARLPVLDLQEIGVNWIRTDQDGNVSLTQMMVEDHLAHWCTHGWTIQNVLWLIGHGASTPFADVEVLVDCGVTEIETGNEPLGGWWWPPLKEWTPYRYAAFVRSMRAAAGDGPTFYGGSENTKLGQKRFDEAGVPYDIHAMHPYIWPPGSQEWLYMAQEVAAMRADTDRPVMVSEVSCRTVTAAAGAEYFAAARAMMGSDPWCYYDGPATDARGLFAETSPGSGVWTEPAPALTLVQAVPLPPPG